MPRQKRGLPQQHAVQPFKRKRTLSSKAAPMVTESMPAAANSTQCLQGATGSNHVHSICLNMEAHVDINMWKIFIDNFNGKSMFFSQYWVTSEDMTLFSDAAGSIGLDGVLFCVTSGLLLNGQKSLKTIK